MKTVIRIHVDEKELLHFEMEELNGFIVKHVKKVRGVPFLIDVLKYVIRQLESAMTDSS